MARPLRQLKKVCDSWYIPCVIAGDIFDKWNAPAELINFAIDNLPDKVYAVPGQHDLPNHDASQVDRSAYGTLVKSNTIEHMEARNPCAPGRSLLYGYGWNSVLGYDPSERTMAKNLCVAVVHRYCWKDDKTVYHESAKVADHNARSKQWAPYDLTIFGDNHIPFHWVSKEQKRIVVNCGAFIPRTIKEVKRPTRFGVWLADGSVILFELDSKDDKWTDSATEFTTAAEALDLDTLEQLLRESTLDGLDFRQTVMDLAKRYEVSQQILAKLMEALRHGTPKD